MCAYAVEHIFPAIVEPRTGSHEAPPSSQLHLPHRLLSLAWPTTAGHISQPRTRVSAPVARYNVQGSPEPGSAHAVARRQGASSRRAYIRHDVMLALRLTRRLPACQRDLIVGAHGLSLAQLLTYQLLRAAGYLHGIGVTRESVPSLIKSRLCSSYPGIRPRHQTGQYRLRPFDIPRQAHRFWISQDHRPRQPERGLHLVSILSGPGVHLWGYGLRVPDWCVRW